MSEEPKHTISILVENESGVLSRVAGMFSGRGFNIESLSVAPTLESTVSRITLTVFGDGSVLEQVIKQLNKLVPVIRVVDFREGENVEREMALIKADFSDDTRAEVMNAVSIFRASIVDVGHSSCIIETTGSADKINALVRVLRPLGIQEIARTGCTTLYRGERLLTVHEEGGGSGEKEKVA